ncbi:unnamed protein product [Darwinula stevensoni]|uniref:Saposin B-type domain-containing protein n=1 Tax=Darwinula stevensoni TaxID=69355 RepID=A0A7R8X4V0_9CRUS|nr:unnamed protein product [Darwinula stevensoni]CAG0884083.1 unnamed protein product [Darwinula stevensoni]
MLSLKLPAVFLLLSCSIGIGECMKERDISILVHFYKDLVNHGLPSTYTIPEVVQQLRKIFFLEQELRIGCIICTTTAELVIDQILSGTPPEDLTSVIEGLCELFGQEPVVCEGLVYLFAPIIYYVVQNGQINVPLFCNLVADSECTLDEPPGHDWELELPDIPKPNISLEIPVRIFIITNQNDPPRLKIIHLTDTHFDPEYEEGSNANCGLYLCCQSKNGPAPTPEEAAGKYGDYRSCDAPLITVQKTLEHVAQTHPDADIILWTGDQPPHDIWDQSIEENVATTNVTVALMKEYFPSTPIFPVVGNHEAWPVNIYTPEFVPEEEFSADWLYNALWANWMDWLPGDQAANVQHGAYYSVAALPGLRIITINNMFCYALNWFLWMDLNIPDPDNHLQWLINELQAAETANEKVWILGHIPPGSTDCLPTWSRNYRRIINRYENTVVGQFFGHTHDDEYLVFYDMDDPERAINVGYVGPSITPYSYVNPSYRVYYADASPENPTYAIIDHETWTFNLDEANLSGEPNWYLLYDARTAYGLPNLQPGSWSDLAFAMAQDDALFEEFWRYRHRESSSPDIQECDAECRTSTLCFLVRADSRECMKEKDITSLVHLYKDLVKEGLPTKYTILEVTKQLRNIFFPERELRIDCFLCEPTANLYIDLINGGMSEEELEEAAMGLCDLFGQEPIVCEGLISAFVPIAIYIVLNGQLNVPLFCNLVAGSECTLDEPPGFDWEVELPDIPKPNISSIIPDDPPRLKIVHLTDTHFDPEYAEGANANCGLYHCCQSKNGPAPTPEEAAGKFGDYRDCDSPLITVRKTLEHVVQTHPDADIIIWTGDQPPHDVWDQSMQENLGIINITVAVMKEYFPTTPIFPVVGNHEAWPVNVFSPEYVLEEDFSTDWLYNALWANWMDWLPEDQASNVQHGAYYSVAALPGLRIITINNMFCYINNWFMWQDLSIPDPDNHLQWLINELQAAELADEKVWILGHIPPGDTDCLPTWSHNYRRIISRYEHTVMGQFFGHTHEDEFIVFYDPEDPERAINVGYVGPSMTPYSYVNPSYRVYYADASPENPTYAIIDHETWTFNLDEANLSGEPNWYRLYEARATYGLPNLQPESWSDLAFAIAQDDALFAEFWMYLHRNSSSPDIQECDVECKTSQLCFLVRADSSDLTQCDAITGSIRQA